MMISVLVGNPSPNSRTLALAVEVADVIGAAIGETERNVIDLAGFAASIFDWKSPEVSALNATVAASDFIVVASPTYKACYTGLLKAFLDRYDTNGLAGTVAIPVMTGGSPAHAMTPDFTLRPLLVELGASTPTRSLYVMTSQMGEQSQIVRTWAEASLPALGNGVRPERRPVAGDA
jgi:FMN reductase